MEDIINFIWNNSVDIFVFQAILSIIYFFLIGWIGSKSYRLGYTSVSLFVQEEEALGFNFVFRVLSPIVYLVIISTILEGIGLSRYVTNVYFIAVCYVMFRVIYIIFSGRGTLVNWVKEFVLWFFIIYFSYVVYYKLIISRVNLLPDFSTVTNELWLVILFFMYEVFNRISPSLEPTRKRINKYLDRKFKKYNNEYGEIINEKFDNDILKPLIYSIMIYESFNRYKIARILEIIAFRFNKPRTLGIMQVKTNVLISDKESVRIAVVRIINRYKEMLSQKGIQFDQSNTEYIPYEVEREIIKDYNPDYNYISDVLELKDDIIARYYPHYHEQFIKKEIKKETKKDVKKNKETI